MTGPGGAPRLRAERAAVVAVFFLLGAEAASWAARIPAVKDHLHLSPGVLGATLLGPAVGAVLAMPVTGAALTRVAPRRIVQVAFLPFGILLPVVTTAGTAWQLFLVLLGWGGALGTIDVAMNTEAAALQDRLGRRIMSRIHAAYSVGGLVGAGAGALAAAGGLSARSDFVVAGLGVAVLGAVSASAFSAPGDPVVAFGRPAAPGHRGDPGARDPGAPSAPGAHGRPAVGPRRRLPARSWTLVALAAVAFGCFLAEGAANDWSAVYLHSSLGASSGLAAVAYTLFSAAMAAGRLAGDHLADGVGAVRLVRLSGAVGAVGFGSALLVGQIGPALAGFVVLGLGLSFVVPLVFTAASQLGQAGPSLATVSSCGYLGLLVGPAIIGGLAQAVGLSAALVVVVVMSAGAALLAGAVDARPPLAEVVS